ncbi:radical SAM protein [Streptomyces sp. NPDC057702]|uniref:radical SAM protein n=1 Tax=unclassified Streptomyces TaxID=2593676 RepID=UPI0036BE1CCF
MTPGLTGPRSVLQVHPTRRCNLSCRHCYSSSGPRVDQWLPLPPLRAAVADAARLGYGVLGVSGGEPLLYPPLAALLATAREHGMGTTVTTNGMLLTERRLAELAGLVDVLAISLDGTPESHARIRRDARSFTRMESRLRGLRKSGMAFGFVFTLTQFNVHELDWVARFATDAGASLLQVHPLEPEGQAAEGLTGAVPDSTELAFALLEAVRVRSAGALAVQVDVTTRGELRQRPQVFVPARSHLAGPLGSWLTPLVIETDGTVTPLTYGFPRRYALGTVRDHTLADLARDWDAEPFRALCADVHERLASESGPPFANWYEEVTRAARALTPLAR